MRICLMGAPGAGKTTLGKALSSYLGIPVISTGDIARKLAETDEETRSALARGEFGPREQMNRLVLRLLGERTSVILDGYPRYQQQLFESYQEFDPMYVWIETPLSMCAMRLNKRSREQWPVNLQRLAFYLKETMPLMLDLLQPTGPWAVVVLSRELPAMQQEVVNAIGRYTDRSHQQIGLPIQDI